MSSAIRMTAHAIGAAVDFNEIDREDVFVDAPAYNALAAELAAIKRTREQEADYANTCYRNQQLEAALNGVERKLAEYLERLLQGRALPNRWVGEINDIVQAAKATAAETPEKMRARIITETADAVAAERGLTAETKDETNPRLRPIGICPECLMAGGSHKLRCSKAETAVNPTMQHAPDCPILHGKECLCDPYPITSAKPGVE